MKVVATSEPVEIVQQNRRGPGRLATRALSLAVGLSLIAVVLLGIFTLIVADVAPIFYPA